MLISFLFVFLTFKKHMAEHCTPLIYCIHRRTYAPAAEILLLSCDHTQIAQISCLTVHRWPTTQKLLLGYRYPVAICSNTYIYNIIVTGPVCKHACAAGILSLASYHTQYVLMTLSCVITPRSIKMPELLRNYG